MKFYSIEKKRNPQCLQCGENVRRVNITITKNARCDEIIKSLLEKGFEQNPDMELILTTMDFDNVKEVELDRTPKQNELRNLELITAAGFLNGEIFITLHII